MAEEKKIVSTLDDAIDAEKSNLMEYVKEYDVKHLVFNEGMVPDYFVIKNIGSSDLVEIQQDHYITEIAPIKAGASLEDMKKNRVKVTPVKTGEMLIKYFLKGCIKIIRPTDELILSKDTLDMIPSAVLQEVGSYIMMRSTVTEIKKK